MKVRKILTMALATTLALGITSNILVPNTFYAKESPETVWSEFDDNKTVGTAETADIATFSLDESQMTEEQQSKYEQVLSDERVELGVGENIQNKGEAYSDYLSQRVEDDFTSIEGIESANAMVTYDESQDQYSIKLSLISDENVNEEQAEMYKSVLRKTYVEVELTINGVLR